MVVVVVDVTFHVALSAVVFVFASLLFLMTVFETRAVLVVRSTSTSFEPFGERHLEEGTTAGLVQARRMESIQRFGSEANLSQCPLRYV